MTSWFLCVIFYFVGFMALHALICRFLGRTYFMKRNILLFLLSFTLLGIQVPSIQVQIFMKTIFFLLWCAYTVVLITVQRSISLGVMRELKNQSRAELENVSRANEGSDELKERLTALEKNGFITFESATSIRLTPKGAQLGRFAGSIRKFFGITQWG